jgi:hypothetical protein
LALRDSLEIEIAESRTVNPDDLRLQNAAVPVNGDFDENEKAVTDIYLATTAKGITTYISEQVTQLTYIANQCPIAGGKAVYVMRDIYALIDEEATYNDTELCEQVGIIMMKTPTNAADQTRVFIQPNPATDHLTVLYQFPETARPTTCRLVAPTGETLLQTDLNTASGTLNLDLTNVPGGVFALVFTDAKSVISSHRVVVIK